MRCWGVGNSLIFQAVMIAVRNYSTLSIASWMLCQLVYNPYLSAVQPKSIYSWGDIWWRHAIWVKWCLICGWLLLVVVYSVCVVYGSRQYSTRGGSFSHMINEGMNICICFVCLDHIYLTPWTNLYTNSCWYSCLLLYTDHNTVCITLHDIHHIWY